MSGPKNEILADVYSNDYICCIIYINRKVTHALMPTFAFSDTFIVRKQNCLMPVRNFRIESLQTLIMESILIQIFN